ncbi:Flotillin-1 [Varanus komodoensis]|nr:Flotillin-1 [Varanus komodoensis]
MRASGQQAAAGPPWAPFPGAEKGKAAWRGLLGRRAYFAGIKMFFTCGPNEAMVVSGFCRSPPVMIAGGRVFVMPCIQQIQRISLNTLTLNVKSEKVYTRHGVPISVTGIAQSYSPNWVHFRFHYPGLYQPQIWTTPTPRIVPAPPQSQFLPMASSCRMVFAPPPRSSAALAWPLSNVASHSTRFVLTYSQVVAVETSQSKALLEEGGRRWLGPRHPFSFSAFLSPAPIQVKIQGQNKEMLAAACQMFLGKSEAEIAQIALETLEGHQRAIMAHMTVEEIYKDRQKFSEQVFKVASSDLVNMGISVVSYTLKDIHDDQDYLHSLGKARTAQVQKDARIGEAEAKRDAGIKEAKAKQEKLSAQYLSEIEMAKAQRDYELKKATYDIEVNTRKAESDLAYQLQILSMLEVLFVTTEVKTFTIVLPTPELYCMCYCAILSVLSPAPRPNCSGVHALSPPLVHPMLDRTLSAFKLHLLQRWEQRGHWIEWIHGLILPGSPAAPCLSSQGQSSAFGKGKCFRVSETCRDGVEGTPHPSLCFPALSIDSQREILRILLLLRKLSQSSLSFWNLPSLGVLPQLNICREFFKSCLDLKAGLKLSQNAHTESNSAQEIIHALLMFGHLPYKVHVCNSLSDLDVMTSCD